VTLLIVAFWLAASGWFFWREVWPSLRAGDPPPYTIDLIEEARQLPIHWDVLQDGKKVGKAVTQIKYNPADDTFALEGKAELTQLFGELKAEVLSTYHVTRAGDLQGVNADATLSLPAHGYAVTGHVECPVRDGFFRPEGRVNLLGQQQELKFDPVEVSGRGNVLNPLHPVNRIDGLRPGRSWQVSQFNPMAVLASARIEGKNGNDPLVQTLTSLLRGQEQFRKLNATVLEGTQPLTWDDHEERCLVVEYRDADVSARTWVRQKDGTVLQQEVGLGGDRLVLKRVSYK
jgi:hypothetical protein